MNVSVWVIILIAVIVVMRDAKRKQQRQDHQDPGRAAQQMQQRPAQQMQQRPVQQMQQFVQQMQQRAAQPVQQRAAQPAQQNYRQAPQRAAYQQANGRYSRMPNPKQSGGHQAQPMQGGRAASGGDQPKPNDILSRAAANVRENEADELRMSTDPVRLVTDEPSELMRQVNDLMVMGYQADLSFERDFVAEGVELLAGYEISGELQEAKI